MPQATLRVNFYCVQMPPNAGSFEELVGSIKRKRIKNRVRTMKGDIKVRLQLWRDEGDYFVGELVRVRTSDVPPMYDDAEEDPEEVGLKKGQGLGEECAFVYYPTARVLVFQENKRAMSVGRAIAFLEQYLPERNDGKSIECDWVKNVADLKRFNSMKICREVEVRMAPVNNLPRDEEAEPAPAGIIDAASHLRAAHVTARFTMGEEKGSMAVSGIRAMWRWLKGSGHEVERFRLRAKETEEETLEPLDLLVPRISQTYTVTWTGESMPQGVRLQAVEESFEKWRGAIDDHYRIKR